MLNNIPINNTEAKDVIRANQYLGKNFSFPCPAKLNLFLHIVGQRDDGYHELETMFQFIDYGDTIRIKTTNNNKITLLTPIEGVNNEDNLIIKAARLLQGEMSLKKPHLFIGADIQLQKRLPMGGGLGGGSSNAATILLALNKLWQCHLSLDILAKLGLKLGADVPVFIHGFAAFAQGVGEKFTPATPQEYWYLITKPNCSISTKEVFTATELSRNTKKLPLDTHATLGSNNDLFSDLFHNDCQELVIKHYPEVAKLLTWLVEYAPSRMTGTGACIFSRFTSRKQAYELQEKLPKGTYSFIARGLNKSPLLNTINAL